MSPAALRGATALCLALGLTDLAWLDARAGRLSSAPAAPAVATVVLRATLLPAPTAPATPVAASPTAPTAETPVAVAPAAPLPSCTLYFATASDSLGGEAWTSLGAVVTALGEDRTAVALVEGYADARGPKDFNMRLSERRAAAVAQWLRAHGVSDDRIRTSAFGDTRLVDDAASPAALQRNRRVEVHLQREEGEP